MLPEPNRHGRQATVVRIPLHFSATRGPLGSACENSSKLEGGLGSLESGWTPGEERAAPLVSTSGRGSTSGPMGPPEEYRKVGRKSVSVVGGGHFCLTPRPCGTQLSATTIDCWPTSESVFGLGGLVAKGGGSF